MLWKNPALTKAAPRQVPKKKDFQMKRCNLVDVLELIIGNKVLKDHKKIR